MEFEQVLLFGSIAIVGGVVSHVLANRRIFAIKKQAVLGHVKAVGMLADAAVEIMAVDCNMDVQDAQKRLIEEADKRGLRLSSMLKEPNPQQLARAREHIAKQREARKGATDVVTDDKA